MAASDPWTDVPPAAREAVTRLTTAPTEPVKLLVSGGIGTGKSTVLATFRTALRSAGVPVLTRPARADDDPGAAIVVDDAHLLTDDDLDRLSDRVADPASTVVVGAEPLAHRPALRALVTAVERENAIVALGPLSSPDITNLAAETLGGTPAPGLIRSLLVATAGLPFLLRPAMAAAASPDDQTPAAAVLQAAKYTLIERLRLVDGATLDTLLMTSLSRDIGPDDVAGALQMSAEDAYAVVDRARATGLIEPSYSRAFLRALHQCIAQILGTTRHRETEISLLVSQLESSTLSADLALQLAEHGLRDDRLATALTELASHSRQPARAARLYRAAVDAGASTSSPQLADALAMTGDCVTAARLTDELLGSEDPAQRAAAVRIAASVAVHDGGTAQAADLFRWLGAYPDAFVSAAGAVVTLAAGDLPAARAALSAESSGPPTSTARAARSLADGLLMSLDTSYPAAVARLGQAITTEQPAAGVAPDTPAALVTLAALHGGDPVRARSVIARAVRAGLEDGAEAAPFVARRHRLLLGWVRMQDGQLSAASSDATIAGTDRDASSLHRRDALWAAALQTAIARRSGDTGAMQTHWYAAVEVLAEYSMDLFSLLPLGELWVAASRIRQVDRLQHTLDEAFALLRALGDPVLWSAPLRWAGVHAGILANSPDAVAPHGQALTAAAAHSAFATTLATAGRTWLRVLANHVDVDEVTGAARLLAQAGLTWDATRLAGQAALQTPDGRVSGAMLQLARDLKQTVALDEMPGIDQAAAREAPRAGGARPMSSRLSDREREVAELLLLGMPYRDIGAQLFISAKTVEHHVARIRRRLGAESRSEMLSMLRAMLTPQT
ncbi:LuxR family transcriptional regulator [Mycolicibacterium sp. GF69]|uniref:isoniazid response ATPase/transcriptional regulator IniR n=1 Tax=Mycolicibacterium sp. GF69 TaxID=2267251 RepID=UPI000DCB3615|nr:isoniazid response ATPase/transcriptional regulator IniR [Mycolicibacterium sp. GF69]RAV18111.1 LuxR family transcriptional regulator [Mycolicibacterium sp. GF69]